MRGHWLQPIEVKSRASDFNPVPEDCAAKLATKLPLRGNDGKNEGRYGGRFFCCLNRGWPWIKRMTRIKGGIICVIYVISVISDSDVFTKQAPQIVSTRMNSGARLKRQVVETTVDEGEIGFPKGTACALALRGSQLT